MMGSHMLMVFLIALPHASPCQQAQPAQAKKQHLTVFESIMRVGLVTRVPLGVILDEKNTLCLQSAVSESLRSSINLSELKSMLASSHYYMKPMEGGSGYVIGPENISQEQAHILTLRISHFDPPPATLHTLGVFLQGEVTMILHPEYGFAGNIPFSLDAQKVHLELEDRPVQEVSNAIVSAAGKGVWIMPYLSGAMSEPKQALVHIDGYDEDALTISQLQCSSLR